VSDTTKVSRDPLVKLADFGTSRLETKRAQDYESSHWKMVADEMDRILHPLPKYEEIQNHLRRFHEDRKTRLGHYKASPQGADFYEEVLYRCREELNALRGS
jgi:hypothetical protein